jgi:hypothetical protein
MPRQRRPFSMGFVRYPQDAGSRRKINLVGGLATKSIGGRQPLHRELDPAVAKVAPAFHFGHIGSLWVAFEDRFCTGARLFQRQSKGLAPKSVGRPAASGHPGGQLLWRSRHEIPSFDDYGYPAQSSFPNRPPPARRPVLGICARCGRWNRCLVPVGHSCRAWSANERAQRSRSPAILQRHARSKEW